MGIFFFAHTPNSALRNLKIPFGFIAHSLKFSGWPQTAFQSLEAFWRQLSVWVPQGDCNDSGSSKIVTKSEPKTPPKRQHLWKLMPVHTVFLLTFILKDPVYTVDTGDTPTILRPVLHRCILCKAVPHPAVEQCSVLFRTSAYQLVPCGTSSCRARISAAN